MPAACLVVALCWSAALGNAASPDPAPTQLLPAARSWVASLPGASPAVTEFVPMDPRSAATACASGWRFDLPFADPRAVRARCDRPQAQVFLRALQALRPVHSGSSAPAAASASTPARTPTSQPRPVASPTRPAAETATATATTTATATATAKVGDTQPVPADATRQVVIARSDLRRGDLLSPAMVESVRLADPPRRGFGAPVEDPSTLDHMEMVRDKPAGQVLYAHDMQPALLVRRGQLIAVSMQGVPGLQITARLEALQDGRHGQSVRLRNPESGRIVSAVVTGPSEARLP